LKRRPERGSDHGADEFSDLDVELYLTDAPFYAARREGFAPSAKCGYLDLSVEDGVSRRGW
jgi:hypothetical protein